jgi:hypothetical protein
MQRLGEPRARPGIRRALTIAAALLCATALGEPNLAYAGPHGGGGGGGFHGGGMGGFHGGGFGGFHGHFAGMHHGFGERHDGFRRGVFIGGLGFGYYGYPYGWDYSPDYGYYGYSQPSSQDWYYCSDPAGYYPYVAQCNTGWQAVPAN